MATPLTPAQQLELVDTILHLRADDASLKQNSLLTKLKETRDPNKRHILAKTRARVSAGGHVEVHHLIEWYHPKHENLHGNRGVDKAKSGVNTCFVNTWLKPGVNIVNTSPKTSVNILVLTPC